MLKKVTNKKGGVNSKIIKEEETCFWSIYLGWMQTIKGHFWGYIFEKCIWILHPDLYFLTTGSKNVIVEIYYHIGPGIELD